MPHESLQSHETLFGTDGVRGLAGTAITPALAAEVARAFAAMLREEVALPHLLIARDTRVSGPELSDAFRDELCRCGVRVTDCGVIPTGGLCLLVSRRDADGGAIISASHNPPEFNGIKLVGRGGHKLPLDRQQQLEDLIRSHPAGCLLPATDSGTCSEDAGAAAEYLEIVLEGVEPASLRGLRVLLDCAHGSASSFAPAALEYAGAEVHSINCDADGAQINVNCGSTHPALLTRVTVQEGADIGVAFDGDADRVVLSDHRGRVIDGDASKYILAMDLQQRGLLEPPLVIGTVMNNYGLERALEDAGIALERTPVGDRHVVERMRETGALLGGEQSGHLIFRDSLIGDGIRSALRLCEVVVRSGKSLAELAGPVRKIPQHLVNIHAENRDAWQGSDEVLEEISGWERRLEGRGRILVRSSGTEPLVRIMVEAEDDEIAREAVHAVSVAIRMAATREGE